MRRRLFTITAAGIVVALAACGGGEGGDAAPGAPTAATSVLDFSAPTVSGERIEGSAYAGQDLVMWFWAPW